jgi:S-formylglutathione hydrolase FrmB
MPPNRPALPALLLALAIVPAVDAQVTVLADSLAAPNIGHQLRYQVMLPEGYDSGQRYPTLWLLHGFGQDDSSWLRHTQLIRYVRPYPLIVVLPNVENSWYVNSVADPTARYEDAMTQDLYHTIVARYAVDTTRQGVVGMSMGGYGAVMLGLRHYARFRFIGALSPALNVRIEDIDPLAAQWGGGPSLVSAFGSGPSAHRSGHDPFVLFRLTPANQLPYVYLAIGTEDEFVTALPLSRDFADSLRHYGARYEYHERPGTHSWLFWDTELPPLVRRMWVELTAPRLQPSN